MVRCTRYNIVIKFVSELRQVGGFLQVFWFPPPIKHYVIKFVSHLRQVDGFFRVLWFPSPLKLAPMI